MRAIVIMARKPEPGKVKTRLVPPLSIEDASRIYHCFLLDRMEQVKEVADVSRHVAYTPESAKSFFEGIIPKGFGLLSQVGTDLGQRLANVSEVLFDRGYYEIVMVDSDSPDLPTEYISLGFQSLEEADIVLGPCQDGGYYLVGLRERTPEIFRDIPWSTSSVTDTTFERARGINKTIALLPQWYDIDTVEDLMRLKREIGQKTQKVKSRNCCRNTSAIINDVI